MEVVVYRTLRGELIPVGQRRRFPGRALGMRCLGACLLLLSLPLLAAAQPKMEGIVGFSSFVGTSLTCNYFAFLCFFKARALKPPSLEECLSDPRGVVLYLRFFGDDERTRFRVRDLLLLPLFPTWTFRGKEVHLHRAFGEYGPVIAIGRPGDRHPPFGAYRLFVDVTRWREVVLDLMERSQLVILRAAVSPGLAWELEQVLSRVPPRRFVLFLPFGRREWGVRLEAFGALFNRHCPEPLVLRDRSPLVVFDDSWRSCGFRCRWPGYLPPSGMAWLEDHPGFHGLCEYWEQVASERRMPIWLAVVAITFAEIAFFLAHKPGP